MVEMQRMTLEYYDEHWRAVGWANGVRGTEAEYLKWRAMTEGEIDGRGDARDGEHVGASRWCGTLPSRCCRGRTEMSRQPLSGLPV